MRKNILAAVFLIPIRRIFITSVLVVPQIAQIYAQEIQIKVLDGRNGKPIERECLNIWAGTGRGAHMVAATNGDGVVLLHFGNDDILAEKACAGWPSQVSRASDVEGITISADRYVACQEYGKPTPGESPVNPLKMMPFYPFKSILQLGVSSSNVCGRIRGKAAPGELIFFVRPRSFWEKMRE